MSTYGPDPLHDVERAMTGPRRQASFAMHSAWVTERGPMAMLLACALCATAVLVAGAAFAAGTLAGTAEHEQAPVSAPASTSSPAAALPFALHARQVAPRVWFVQGRSETGSPANANFISNAGFVETHDSVVVIDALGSPAAARAMLAEIACITNKPVSTVILTHYHADHVYGLQVFREAGARIIANRRGRESMESQTARNRLVASRTELAPWIDAKTTLVPADEWIDARTERRIGGTTFVLESVGHAHTAEDITVWVPSQKALFAGDIVFRRRVPYVGQADSRNWIQTLDRLSRLDADVVIPGHGPESMNLKDDAQATHDYLQYLRETMGRAARDLEPFDEAYAKTDWSRFSTLPLFDAANRMNAYNTYLLLEQESLEAPK